MPTNVPPQYRKVEEQYRRAKSPDEKLRLLKEMMSIIPKHKGTEHMRADLKRRMAELREQPKGKKGGPSRQTSAFHIDREGAGQLAVIGMPNVGKSALVDALTGASPEVAAHPFTTWQPTPGMMPIDNIQVQLIDTPPLNDEFMKPGLLQLIRQVDMMLIVVDLQAFPIEQLEHALALLEAHRIAPEAYRDRYADRDDMTFMPALVLVNKDDDADTDEDFAVFKELVDADLPMLPISAGTGRHVAAFKAAIYDRLGIVRIYAKPPGKEPDLSAPFVMYRGGTVEDFAVQVHRDLLETLKSARVWGEGVFDGQTVGRDHVLHDGDVVELRT
jgi:uncharacterized protein